MTTTDATARPRGDGTRTIDPRFAERRRQVVDEHGRRRRRLIGGFLAAGALVAGGVASLFSPLLDVDEIALIGTDSLDLADVTSIGRVAVGDAMVAVDDGEVESLLEDDPRVARASVLRRWPGAVEIRVTDRVVALRLVSEEGSSLVSADGVVVDSADPPPAFGIWDLHVDSLGDAEPGERLPEEMRPVIEVAASMPQRVAIAVKSMWVDGFGDLHLDIGNDREVAFGAPEGAAHKFVAIVTMLGGRVDVEGLCRLDVSDPFAPRITRVPGCDDAGPTASADPGETTDQPEEDAAGTDPPPESTDAGDRTEPAGDAPAEVPGAPPSQSPGADGSASESPAGE